MGHTSPVTAIAFTPDGRYVAAAASDGSIRTWDPATGALLHVNRDFTGAATALTFTEDGRYLITGGDDGSVTLRNARYTTSVDEIEEEHAISLHNRPNPVSGSTVVEYDLPRSGSVRIEMLSSAGEKVATLLDGRADAGPGSVSWDASGQPVGRYYCRLVSDAGSRVVELTVVR